MTMSKDPILLDAKDQILGRLASYVAKKALSGDTIIILNAEKAVISGKRRSIVDDAKLRLRTRTLGTQEHAPVHQRRADLYLRRVVRGMLPWKKSKGRSAFHRVWVYIGVPEVYAHKTMTRVPGADAAKLTASSYLTLEELSKETRG